MTNRYAEIPYAGQLGVTNSNVKVINNSASTLLLALKEMMMMGIKLIHDAQHNTSPQAMAESSLLDLRHRKHQKT